MKNEDTFIRPDDSGIRDKGADRPQYSAGKDYPYDKPVDYGQPNYYDAGSGPAGGLHHGLTPMDTEHSAWDELAEAMGTPYFFQKAYSSQQGSPIPGSATGWSKMPGRETDQDEKEKELEYYGESMEAPPEEAEPPDHDIFDPEKLTDADVEIFMLKIDPSIGQDSGPLGLLSQKSVWPFLEKMLRTEDFGEN